MKYEQLVYNISGDESKLYCYEHTEFHEMPVESRPAILVNPGGGYGMCSDREGEPVAIEFFNRGYNAYVLRYPVAPVRYPAQLVAAANAMHEIRKRAGSCKTDIKRVFAVGFSAGGHLCGCLANCPEDFAPVKKYNFKPNGVILSYAVIGGTPTHGGSFENLLGGMPEGDNAWLNLQTSVRENNPPAFIWATANDQCVPASNSLEYAKAYCEKSLKYELHIFDDGQHGLSVCDERVNSTNPKAKNWIDFADGFLRTL